MKEFIQEVGRIYMATKSLDQTAEATGLSTGKVRKILLTEGLWGNYRSSRIKELREEGKTAEEIAALLSISPKTVSAYSPYTKGEYSKLEKSASAIRSERWRNNKAMLNYSDRVLFPNAEYTFITPSSRDILVYGGFFQFNLSKLMELTKVMEKTTVSLEYLKNSILEEEQEYDEPPIVLEFNPLSLKKNDPMDITRNPWGGYKPLNNHTQLKRALDSGASAVDVYIIRMEEYLPYITLHFREFARYWNEKLEKLFQ